MLEMIQIKKRKCEKTERRKSLVIREEHRGQKEGERMDRGQRERGEEIKRGKAEVVTASQLELQIKLKGQPLINNTKEREAEGRERM